MLNSPLVFPAKRRLAPVSQYSFSTLYLELVISSGTPGDGLLFLLLFFGTNDTLRPQCGKSEQGPIIFLFTAICPAPVRSVPGVEWQKVKKKRKERKKKGKSCGCLFHLLSICLSVYLPLCTHVYVWQCICIKIVLVCKNHISTGWIRLPLPPH